MNTDSAPFGLDRNWLMAIGILVALAVAVGNGVIPKLWARLFRPSLSIWFSRIAEFSSMSGDHYWLRVPISNSEGKYEAKNVEVFIEEFTKLSATGTEVIPGVVPMRFKWCHSEQPSCASIPSGSFRLLHLGFVELKTPTRREGDTLHVSFPSFTLGGEVHVDAHAPLAMGGSFLLSVSISAEGIPTRRHELRVVVRAPNIRDGLPAKVEKA